MSRHVPSPTLSEKITYTGVPACCGADFLYGFYGSYDWALAYKKKEYNDSFALGPVPTLVKFTLAITNKTEENSKLEPKLSERLGAIGLRRLGTFMGIHGQPLTLWGGGPEKYRFVVDPELAATADTSNVLKGYKEALDRERTGAAVALDTITKLEKEIEKLKKKASPRRLLRKGKTGPKRRDTGVAR